MAVFLQGWSQIARLYHGAGSEEEPAPFLAVGTNRLPPCAAVIYTVEKALIPLVAPFARVPSRRKGAGGKGRKVVVGLRDEARRMLAGLPAGGRDYYQQEYGQQAADLLRQARAFNEPDLLAEVMRRFLYTEAGVEATERLATHLL